MSNANNRRSEAEEVVGMDLVVGRRSAKTKESMAYFINWHAAHYGYDDTWREIVRQYYEAFGKEEDDVSGKHRKV